MEREIIKTIYNNCQDLCGTTAADVYVLLRRSILPLASAFRIRGDITPLETHKC